MSTMDEAAPTPDGFGCLNPDGDPEAKPLVESSPTTVASAVSAAGVEVVSAPNPEGSWDRLKQLQRDANHTRLKPSRRGSEQSPCLEHSQWTCTWILASLRPPFRKLQLFGIIAHCRHVLEPVSHFF